MEISSGIFIHLLNLTRSSCEKCNFRPSGRNPTCGPAIPLQRSNQLSYRGQLSSSKATSSCMNTKVRALHRNHKAMHNFDSCQRAEGRQHVSATAPG